MKKILFTSVLMFISLIVQSQTMIQGIVTTTKGETVIGANVALENTYDVASTDTLGHFHFTTEEKGSKRLIVTFIGCDTLRALGKAQAINAENPRIYMIRGEFTLNMPEFYGGGAAKATPDIQKAAEKFETFKPASPLSPNWGKEHNAAVAKRIEVMAAVKGK